MDLSAFFDGWIYGSSVPVLGFSSTLTATEVRIRIEHRGAIIPTPVTVSIFYTDNSIEDVVVLADDRVVERTLPLQGPVRTVEINRDHGAVAEVVR